MIPPMQVKIFTFMLLAFVSVGARAAVPDPTSATLTRCLNDPANASTAGQTGCERGASQSYDRRMNAAYAALMRKLPPAAGLRLKLSQRAWLAFRDSEIATRDTLYDTRQGTMYVPMQASDATNAIRDRAFQLEGYLRVLSIQ